MKYAILLILLGIMQIALSLWAGIFALMLIWSGLSWGAVGMAYARQDTQIFGKRADGQMSRLRVVLLLPYLAVTWLIWRMQVFIAKEPCSNEIIPGLWLGRRCALKELPGGTMTVVDLTAEFAEPKDVVQGHMYWSLPILDASVPTLARFRDMVKKIVAAPSPVYVHCALGHGRSATMMIAMLIAKGQAATLQDAERLVKAARPRIKINAMQQHLLEQWLAGY